MNQDRAFVGLDMHREKIAVAIALGREAPHFEGVILNRPEAMREWALALRRRFAHIEALTELARAASCCTVSSSSWGSAVRSWRPRFACHAR